MRIEQVLLVMGAVCCTACAAPVKSLFPPSEGEPVKSIYLVSHGWHAGIVLRRTDIPPELWPARKDFPHVEFLEVGWGDRAYYQTPDPHLGNVLKAALWPTSSVLHVVGFRSPVAVYFPNSEIIEIELTDPGFRELIKFIGASFSQDEAGYAHPLGPGLYGDSRFYRSRETYHLFKTCNVWTARALRAAGCPVTPSLSLGVESLMDRVRTFGRVVPAVTRPYELNPFMVDPTYDMNQ